MSPKVTEEHKQAVHDKILQSAEILFARKGYHGTSMDDIVRDSGLSKGAIYWYFKSKQDIFLALSDRRLTSRMDEIKSSFTPGDSAKKKLEKIAEYSFRPRTEDSREFFRINLEIWVEAPRIKTLQHRLENRYEKAHRLLAEIINEGVKTGEFKQDLDSDALASILLATIDGLSLHWATTGKDFDWQKLKNALVSAFGEGMLQFSEARKEINKNKKR